MNKNLIIIESPNKIKTINKIVDHSLDVLATFGHLRDLSVENHMGFDVKTFDCDWKWMNNAKIVFNKINQKANNAKKIYLACDPDREGEAIAWHVYNLLSKPNQKKCKRIVFNEITKTAIENAFLNEREILDDWVNAYLARRLLDRYIGFKLSWIVKSKFNGISAGRVQSIALKFLCERQKEIDSFQKSFWYTLNVVLKGSLDLKLIKLNEKFKDLKIVENKTNEIAFLNEEDANLVLNDLKEEYHLLKIGEEVEEFSKPKEPYKTSTLQQDCISKLNMTAKEVEGVAQKLYEGINIDGNNFGLITYPRTDAINIANEFSVLIKNYILKNYGNEYLEVNTNSVKNHNKNMKVQGAHEAIRISNLDFHPNKIKNHLNEKEYAVYKMIWVRTIAFLMNKAIYISKKYDFENNGNNFSKKIKNLKFNGYLKIYEELNLKDEIFDENDEILEDKNLKLVENNYYLADQIEIKKHEKKPPPYLNESTLIKSLEKEGVGRPSTYVAITNLIVARNYALKKLKSLIPTELGLKIIQKLEENFNDIMKFSYTKNMEDNLDQIADGNLNYKTFLRKVFDEFDKQYNLVNKMTNTYEYINKKCPNCNDGDLFNKKYTDKKTKEIKTFIACTNYPKCYYIGNNDVKKNLLEEKCPECQKSLVERKSKENRKFIGCSGYPGCKFTKPIIENKT